MALKVLLLRKQRENKGEELNKLHARDAEFESREAELEKAISEVETDQQRSEVEELVTAFDTEREQHRAAIAALEAEIRQIETDLQAAEAEQNTEPKPGAPEPADHENERSNITMNTRAFKSISIEQRDAMIAREDVKSYLGEVRSAIREKRAITNVGLTIPEVLLPLIKDNIATYSKLIKHVTVVPVSGTGRQNIMGNVPEAIWTDCCATLNELSLVFNDVEVDCFKVGAYYAICNANIEDSDVDLASEIITALSKGTAMATDKAILYGRNSATTQKMPQGIVSRLVQTEAPSGYPATARAWVDLHTTNVVTITAANSTGTKLITSIVEATGAMSDDYSKGEITWVMNNKTKTKILAQTVATTADGRIVAGVNNTMPVLGGDIETLKFIPDNVIIAGYFDDYLLAERAGTKFASSEHVRFIQDQTVFKGVTRYDGAPVIPEAFMAIGINGTTPNATMTFPTDTANA